MTRLKPLTPAEMTPAQLKIIATKAERATQSPFMTFLHQPVLAEKIMQIRPYWHQTTLEYGLLEFAIAIVARKYTIQFLWLNHAKQSLDNGIDADVIEAIKHKRQPAFKKETEAFVYDFTMKMLDDAVIDDELYARGMRILGKVALIDLVFTIGFYLMVAFQNRTFGLGLSEGSIPELED